MDKNKIKEMLKNNDTMVVSTDLCSGGPDVSIMINDELVVNDFTEEIKDFIHSEFLPSVADGRAEIEEDCFEDEFWLDDDGGVRISGYEVE